MELNELVENLNFKRNVSFTKKESVRTGYIAEFADETFGMTVCFTKHFPLNLPDFFVPVIDEVRPHIERNGRICLFDASSVLIDENNINELLIECYDQAVSVLQIDSNTDLYRTEILREADSYWLQVSKKSITSTVDISKATYLNREMIHYSGEIAFYVADTEEKTRVLGATFAGGRDKEAHLCDCTIIRLKKGSPLITIKDRYGWNELRQYIRKYTDNGVKRRFKKHTDIKKKAVIEAIILVLPSDFGEIAFGFLVMGRSNRWVPMSMMLGLKCTPLYVRRMDYNYLVNRAGAMNELENKQILLLGCGSVGGYIAENLCKMGVRNLDILDKDSFSESNLFRHYLGMNALANKLSNKAQLMKNQLESEFLDIDIDSLDFKEPTVEAYLQEPDRLKNYDLIISALGEPTLNLKINRILRENDYRVPFICSYNEPYGIGGHAILTNTANGEGCLECLYTNIDSSELRENRISLVKEGQNFKKNISGCGGSYVPYSALDSQQTAIHTVRLAISVLRGELAENCVITWFGDDEQILSQGFITSEYYQNNKDRVKIKCGIKKNPFCKVCKG